MLFVIGDSHSIVWGGRLVSEMTLESRFPLVRLHHLGPALAYNLLADDGSPGKWGRVVIDRLASDGAGATAILLSFGEIDVRTQILKRAIGGGTSIAASVGAVVRRYAGFVALLRRIVSVPIFLWGPIASARDFGRMDPDFPVVGSEMERNAATIAFNELLHAETRTLHDVHHFSVNDALINRALQTRTSMFEDGVHLGTEALDLAIAGFERSCARAGLSLPGYFRPVPYAAADRTVFRDIAGGARIVQMSSNQSDVPPSRITKDASNGTYIFHTMRDPAPFVVVDIGHVAFVRAVRIYNRLDGERERARSLEVSVGNDRKNYRIISPPMIGDFGADGRPVEMAVEPGKSPFRYMYLRLRESQFFHLGGIEILAETFG